MSVTYTVKYKKLGSLFSKTVKKVKGDFVATDIPGSPRVLVLDDEKRIEIPTTNMVFEFSNERFLLIKQRMESDVGQSILVNTK